MEVLDAAPRLTAIPALSEGEVLGETSEFNVTIESATFKFCVSIVVVVPDTVKLPASTRLPVIVCVAEVSLTRAAIAPSV